MATHEGIVFSLSEVGCHECDGHLFQFGDLVIWDWWGDCGNWGCSDFFYSSEQFVYYIALEVWVMSMVLKGDHQGFHSFVIEPGVKYG